MRSIKKIIAIGTIFIFLFGSSFSLQASSINMGIEHDNMQLPVTPTSLNNGKTLYVGGSGPNNYTKIQDAIDDASDGDTVFVYDNSSPYYEYLVVDKSINLIGEDRDTTVIESKGIVIRISADWVNISGFTIRNGVGGIYISSNYNTISGNNIHSKWEGGIRLQYSNNNIISDNNISKDDFAGIYLYCSSNNTVSDNNINLSDNVGLGLEESNNNTITGNNISNNNFGLGLWGSNNTIKDNTITSNNRDGISLWGNSNTVSSNNISNNECGIYLDYSNHNNITKNNIQNNDKLGLFLSSANYNVIESNNFIGNKIQAFFIFSWGNNWDENYWDNWIGFKIKLPIFPKVIIGFIGINFDWHPAQEPYDMPGGGTNIGVQTHQNSQQSSNSPCSQSSKTTMMHTGTLEVTVKHAIFKTPIINACVVALKDIETDDWYYILPSGIGVYKNDNLAAGDYFIGAGKEGYTIDVATVTIKEGEQTTYALYIKPEDGNPAVESETTASMEVSVNQQSNNI